MATEVAGAQLCLKVQHAAFKNRKGYIHKNSYYSTIRNRKILETSQMSINRRLAYEYGKSKQGSTRELLKEMKKIPISYYEVVSTNKL